MLPLLLMSCAAKVHELYDASKAYALQAPPELAEDWTPDASVRVSGDLVADLLSHAIDGAFDGAEAVDVGVGTVTPRLRVKKLELLEQAGCERCVAVKGVLRGNAAIDVGPLETDVPLALKLGANLRVQSVDKGPAQTIQLRVAKVRNLTVVLGDDDLALDAGAALEEWGEDLVEALPPIPLGVLGGDDLPVRALRIVPEGGGVRADMRTSAAHGGDLPDLGAAPESGIAVRVSSDTLLDYARKAAFEQGALEMDVHVEPSSLTFDGDRFEMVVRLWRLQERRAWWRDYHVSGPVSIVEGRLRLEADQVEQIAASRGAGLLDPLALLARGRILEGIESGAQQAFPIDKAVTTKSGLRVEAVVDQATGVDGDLNLVGQASVERKPPKKKKGKKTR